MPNQQTALDNAFHALSDATRRAVVQQLATGPSTVSELAQPFDMAMPSFLQHIRVLETCGLIKTRKQGRTRHCEFTPEKLADAQGWLGEQRKIWEGRLDRLDAYIETLSAQKGAPQTQKGKRK